MTQRGTAALSQVGGGACRVGMDGISMTSGALGPDKRRVAYSREAASNARKWNRWRGPMRRRARRNALRHGNGARCELGVSRSPASGAQRAQRTRCFGAHGQLVSDPNERRDRQRQSSAFRSRALADALTRGRRATLCVGYAALRDDDAGRVSARPPRRTQREIGGGGRHLQSRMACVLHTGSGRRYAALDL